jgi:hypothetical protein
MLALFNRFKLLAEEYEFKLLGYFKPGELK